MEPVEHVVQGHLVGPSARPPTAWLGPAWLPILLLGWQWLPTRRIPGVQDVIAQARDTLTLKRMFGEPYEKDGLTVIPAARAQGAAGGGSGEDSKARARDQAAPSA